MEANARPRVGVFKFASCDGCQLTLLDLEEELLALGDRVEFVEFREASSAVGDGPLDLAIVEGSVTTPEDRERIVRVRSRARTLVAIGACATAGGIQALRNFADVEEFRRAVYARPEVLHTLSTSTPIQDHVRVDAELRGCPIQKRQLREMLLAYLHRRRPDLPRESVCMECKRRGTVCVLVAHGTPCLGPITQAGCGAICPAFDRGCYGCFGPQETVHAEALGGALERVGMQPPQLRQLLRTYNVNAPAFRAAAERIAEDG